MSEEIEKANREAVQLAQQSEQFAMLLAAIQAQQIAQVRAPAAGRRPGVRGRHR
jgi:hypothetical protein